MPLSESSCDERPRDGELLGLEELPWLDEPCWLEEPRSLEEPLIPEERSLDEPLWLDEPVWLEEPRWLDEPVWLEEPRWLDEPVWLEEPRWLEEPLIPEERSDDVRPDMPEPPDVSAAPLVPPLELLLEPWSLSAELPIPSSFRLPRSVRAPSDESRSLEPEALCGESLLRVLESGGVDLPTFCDERSRSFRSSLRFAMCFLHLLRWCAVHRHSSGVGATNV